MSYEYVYITKNIKNVIDEYGIKNFRVFMEAKPLQYVGIIPGIAFTSSNSETSVQEFEIDESRYPLEDDYKIAFKPINHMYASERFYCSDFDSLVNENPDDFRFYVLNSDGYQSVTHLIVK